jgi:succinate dehydrogenase / fumarate reductase cytochrome b subunit
MSVANQPTARPLFPHLEVYRPQLTSVLSILHRATGIALSVGAFYLAIWVIYAASNPRPYALFQGFNMSILDCILLDGWLLSVNLCNGIRHLFWDAGYGFELEYAYRSGWTVVVVVSLTATIVSWIVRLRLM